MSNWQEIPGCDASASYNAPNAATAATLGANCGSGGSGDSANSELDPNELLRQFISMSLVELINVPAHAESPSATALSAGDEVSPFSVSLGLNPQHQMLQHFASMSLIELMNVAVLAKRRGCPALC